MMAPGWGFIPGDPGGIQGREGVKQISNDDCYNGDEEIYVYMVKIYMAR